MIFGPGERDGALQDRCSGLSLQERWTVGRSLARPLLKPRLLVSVLGSFASSSVLHRLRSSRDLLAVVPDPAEAWS